MAENGQKSKEKCHKKLAKNEEKSSIFWLFWPLFRHFQRKNDIMDKMAEISLSFIKKKKKKNIYKGF